MVGISVGFAASLNGVMTLFPGADTLRLMGAASWLIVFAGLIWWAYETIPWEKLTGRGDD